MPNTFGAGSAQVELLHFADEVKQLRRRFGRPPVRELDYANSMYVPGGRTPARGWILLPRADYDRVAGYGTSYQLQMDNFDASAPPVTLGSLAIVQARCVTTGIIGDPGAVYLVELTDRRGVISNRWFDHGLDKDSYYNILSPAYPEEYYQDSLDGGGEYTWSTLVEDLWGQLPLLGAYPNLASAASGTPTNWTLPGASAWHSICDILDRLGMAVSVDLTSATPYSIVSLGGNDAGFTAKTALYSGRQEDDLDWIVSPGSGRIPGTIVVFFRRINEYYGSEETVRRTPQQWATDAAYSVPIAAPFGGGAGTHHMWDDFCIRYDVSGDPLAADIAEAGTIAAERAQQYFRMAYSDTLGSMTRTYAGALPFATGAQVDGVCWRQDARGGRLAWRTEVRRGELWEEVR